MPFLGFRGSPGDGSKLKIDQKTMTNLMNHFSEVRKRALAAKIKKIISESFFEQTCENVEKYSRELEGIRSSMLDVRLHKLLGVCSAKFKK